MDLLAQVTRDWTQAKFERDCAREELRRVKAELAKAQARIAELDALVEANGDELKSARAVIYENARLKRGIKALQASKETNGNS